MQIEQTGDTVKITLPPIFSVEEAAAFRAQANTLVDAGGKFLHLDFGVCNFIDSTGLGVVVQVYKRCREAGGGVTLSRLQPQVRKVFELTRLDQIFDIV